MRRIYLGILSGLVSLFSLTGTAQVRFDHLHRELGSLIWHTPGTAVFTLSNEGDTTLVIRDVDPDCGCTAVDWPRTPIAPGQKAVIKAVFDAELLGHFEKQIAVYTDQSDKPYYLTLSGDVVVERKENMGDYPYHVGDLYLNADNVEFDDVRRGDQQVKTITIYNAGTKTFTPSLMHLPKYLTAQYEPANIRPGHTGRILLTLDSEQLRTFGLTQTSIYLSRFAGDRVGNENEIYVSATLLPEQTFTAEQLAIAPELHLDSTTVNMGAMNGKKRLKSEVVITNTGKSALEISALQVYNPGLSVSLSKRSLKPGESDKIKITVNANTHYFKGRRRVLLITNDPVRPKVVIDITVKK